MAAYVHMSYALDQGTDPLKMMLIDRIHIHALTHHTGKLLCMPYILPKNFPVCKNFFRLKRVRRCINFGHFGTNCWVICTYIRSTRTKSTLRMQSQPVSFRRYPIAKRSFLVVALRQYHKIRVQSKNRLAFLAKNLLADPLCKRKSCGIITANAVIIPIYRHFPPRLCREPENMAKLYHSAYASWYNKVP